jgi:hypothetical protein
MYSNKFRTIFVISALLLIIAACAKISSPSGGMRDRIPPVVVSSLPMNGAKNFKGKRIEIEFDEYIALDNINDKFMVSPPMKKKPRILVKGKSIRIDFDEKLRDSSTYTLYFMDAIKDLNEGNILDNYKFVFSTGSVIDSLSVTGNVYKALDLEVPEKSTVLLYSNPDDSAVRKVLPSYLSRVDVTGYFRVDNINPGKYRLYALKDDDNSKTYNRVEEPFAFLDTLITITPEKNFIPAVRDTLPTKPITIKLKTASNAPVKKPEPVAREGEYKLIMFEGQKTARYLTKSARDLKYQLIYTLSLPPDTMKFDFSIIDAGPDKYFIEKSRYQDTITVWLTDSALYSQTLIKTIVRYPFTDTLGIQGYKQDTIPMRIIAPRPGRAAKVAKPKLNLKNNLVGVLKPGQNIVFESLTPLLDPDTTKIRLYEIVEKERHKVPYSFIRDNLHAGKLRMDARFTEGSQYLFTADSASFRSIYNEPSDSIGTRFSVGEANSFSKLTVHVINLQVSGIFQLLDNSERLIAQKIVSKDGSVTFSLLDKGQYRLRVIYDYNGDGKWTTGDFTKRRQPEPVTYYPEVLEIKEGWDVDQPKPWDLKDKNVKDQKLRQKPQSR